MATKIDTPTRRGKLEVRREPYWHPSLGVGQAVSIRGAGYRLKINGRQAVKVVRLRPGYWQLWAWQPLPVVVRIIPFQ